MEIESIVFGFKYKKYYFERVSQRGNQAIFLDNPAGVLDFANRVLQRADILIYGRTFEYPLPEEFHQFNLDMLNLLASRDYDKIITAPQPIYGLNKK